MRRADRGPARGGAVARVALRAVALAPALLAGCRGVQSALDPRGPQAARLYELWVVLLAVSAVVYVIVLALVVAAVFRRRTSDDEEGRRRGRGKAVLAGAVATIAILVALLVHSVVVSRAITAIPEGAIRIEIVARQWWWDVTYPHTIASRTVRTANELHVPVGRPVEILVRSADVIHSFWVPSLHGKVDAIPGRTNRLWLQAGEPGAYRGQCAEFCGLQHAKMAFLVVAEPPDAFERWLDLQRRPAPEPEDPLAERGRQVFLGNACASCHTVRGTEAGASAGPDLTHLASRDTIGAGALPNRRGQLAGWILDPQHVKPGVFMPPTALDAESLEALLHYLESLR